MAKRTPLYEGKAKILYEGPEPGTLIQYFKDDATAFNAQKHAVLSGKGVLNARISEFFMMRLGEMGIPNHFIRSLSMREQLVHAVEIIPLEVVVRNISAGSFAKRFGVEEGQALPLPIVEFYLKNDQLGDPMITESHITMFDIADPEELDYITDMALRINDYMSGLYRGIGLQLVDFKVEFGRYYEGEFGILMLADEISPDSTRIWDIASGEKMDKDRFRQDLGNVVESYREVARRLGILPEGDVESLADAGEALKAAKSDKTINFKLARRAIRKRKEQ